MKIPEVSAARAAALAWAAAAAFGATALAAEPASGPSPQADPAQASASAQAPASVQDTAASGAPSAAAAPTSPAAPGRLPAVALKSGRILHNVRILRDEPGALVVVAAEGLIKVAKTDLPADLAAKYPARAAPMETYAAPPLNLAQSPPPPPAPVRPAPTRAARKAEAAVTVFKGCTILGYEPKPFQSALGAVEIRIHNDTEVPAEILPSDIVCVTSDGKTHAGRFLVNVPDNGASIIRRRESIAAYGDLKDLVEFSNEAMDITAVEWARR